MTHADWQTGIILHARPWRETSVILEVFVRELGRCGVVVRGARGERSTLRALVQPFSVVRVCLRGRGDLLTASGLEADGPALMPAPRHWASAFYLNELLMRLLQRLDPHPRLFDAYHQALLLLSQTSHLGPDICLRRFELHLLDELGYAIPFEDVAADVAGHEQSWVWDGEQGFIRAQVASEFCFSGVELRQIAALRDAPDDRVLSDTLRRAARNLMREVLRDHLGSEPLQSRTLFRQLRPSSKDAHLPKDAHLSKEVRHA